MVQRAARDGEYISIQRGDTYTIEYYKAIIITWGDKSSYVKPEQPLTFVTVYADRVDVNIEGEKWKVGGEDYEQLTSWWDSLERWIWRADTIYKLYTSISQPSKLLDSGKNVLSNIKSYIKSKIKRRKE